MFDPEANLQAAERVACLLERRGVPAVVIGAVALAAYRYIRLTEDIDLGVDADLPAMRMLVAALREEGFTAELKEPDGDDPLGGVIDVSGPFGLVQVVSFGGRFPAAIRDALAGDDIRVNPGSKLRIVPLPQLVALKLYAGGSKSKADIVELLRRNPEVDLASIRKVCRRYRLRGLDAILRELLA
jgi:hypothetical protein